MSDERLPDVWATRDYPVLREIARLMDPAPRSLSIHDLAVEGVSDEEMQAALHALRRRGLIEVTASRSAGARNGMVLAVSDLAGDAYIMTGLHPGGDDALLALVDALRRAADDTDNADDRSRMQRAAESLAGVSRNVMQGVLTAYLTGQITN